MSGTLDLRGKLTKGKRRILQAKYDDTCNICLQDIQQGDDIEMTDAGVIHFGCKEDDGDQEA